MENKHNRFIEEYLIDLNATQAAIRAGYSPKTAGVQGAKLLKIPKIAHAIAKAEAERSKRTGINQDRVVMELAKVAFADVSRALNTRTGEIMDNAPPEDLAAIQQVKIKQMEGDKGSSYECEIKLSDKTRALELLGKHLGMWKDKMDVNVNLPVVISGTDELED